MLARLPFVAFCTDVLHLALTPPWVFLLKVAIDGVQPRDLNAGDRAIARQLFGDVEEIDPHVRRVAVWRLGRGSGKTTIAAALVAYEAWTADVSRAGPGQTPTAFVVAPSKPIARIGLTIARELVRGSDLERYIVDRGDVSEGFLLRRPDGRVVAIRSVAASKGGANLRGVDVIVLVLDESEFFASGSDGDYAVTDRDQISAVMPRLIGYVLGISTPWPTENVTSEYFDANFGKPTTAVAALGPSMLMRPSAQLAADIDRERARDPENAAREYDCEPGVRGGNRLFVEGLKEAVVEDRALSIAAPADAIVGCGGDLGLERDSSCIAVVSRVEDLYELCEFDEVRPAKGQPLAPRYVVRERFAPVMRRHGARSIVLDVHYRQSAIEHLSACHLGFEDAPGGMQGKYDSHLLVRGLLRSGKLRLPNSPRLLAQLKAVVATPMPGGGTRITSPRRAGGGHGDVVSALVLAAWQAAGSPTGKRVPFQGWLDHMREETAVLTGVSYSPARARRPHAVAPSADCADMLAPDSDSVGFVQTKSGRAYRVNPNQTVRVLPTDIAELETLGFTTV